jgi:hypothetical protein
MAALFGGLVSAATEHGGVAAPERIWSVSSAYDAQRII